MKKSLILLITYLFSFTALAEVKLSSFDTGGYFRSGFGMNSNHASQTCFQAPGADAKYRLGNECDFFGEVIFKYNQKFSEQPEIPNFTAQVRLEWWINTHHNDNSITTNTKTSRMTFKASEHFIEVNNLLRDNSAKIWAGTRYYLRHEIYPLDMKFTNFGGTGAGLYDYQHKYFKSGFAVFRETEHPDLTTNETDNGPLGQTTFDARFYEIPINDKNQLSVVLDYAYVKNGTVGNTKYYSGTGYAGSLILDTTFMKSQNRAVIQAAQGLMINFNQRGDIIANTQTAADERQRKRKYRLFNQNLSEVNENLELMWVVLWQNNDNGQTQNNRTNWLTLGVNPIYYFTDYVALESQLGMDYVADKTNTGQESARKGTLTKLSLVPQIRMGRGFYTRPVLRAFVTYARWSSQFKRDATRWGNTNNVGGEAYQNKQQGLSVGVQVETWW